MMPVSGDRGGEAGGHGHRVLPGHRVGHQQRLHRIDQAHQPGHLVHQLPVDVQPAGSVEDDVRESLDPGPGERPHGQVGKRLAGRRRLDRHARLAAHGNQLVDRRRPVNVAGHQHHPLPLPGKVHGQLADGGRLAGTLQADHHQRAGRLLDPGQRRILAAQDAHQLLVDDLDHLLGWGEAAEDILPLGPFGHGGGKRLDHLEIDVGLEEGYPDLLEGLVDVGFGQPSPSPQPAEGLGQFVSQCFEHGFLGNVELLIIH